VTAGRLILRINFPYEVARKASAAAENPGIGRISVALRDVAKARRVTDPVYDPKGYHKGHPPAAWAHGPHIDSWAGHSKDGLNIWWAIGPVPAEAGMVLYPELAGKTLPGGAAYGVVRSPAFVCGKVGQQKSLTAGKGRRSHSDAPFKRLI
jgi:hypothetical protein